MRMVKTASDGEQREINDISIRNANFEFEPCDIGLLLRYLLEDIHLHCSATVQKIINRRDDGKNPSSDSKDIESGQLLQILQRHEWVVFMGPDTIDERASALWKRAFSLEELLSFPCSDQFLNEVKGLYGSHVALYFVWMQFFTRMLLLPGVIGAALWYYHWLDINLDVDNSSLQPFFSLSLIVWAFVFLKMWRRRCAKVCTSWGTYGQMRNEKVRAEFYGTKRKSPVTGEDEYFFPEWKRLPYYIMSAAVTAIMLAIAFFVMILSLNMQGYIDDNDGGFYFKVLADLAQPGAVFDPNGGIIMPLVPVVGHSIVIMNLNGAYRHVAEWLTHQENHRTHANHENSLILKRFFFEVFDCYIALFYVAFVQLDVMRLRGELVALYTADSIRRLLTENVIPLILQGACFCGL